MQSNEKHDVNARSNGIWFSAIPMDMFPLCIKIHGQMDERMAGQTGWMNELALKWNAMMPLEHRDDSAIPQAYDSVAHPQWREDVQ